MKYIYLILSLLFLWSCSLESEFSLKNNKKINKELLGVWKIKGKSILEFKKKNDKQYKIFFLEDNEKITGFITRIKGVNLINLTAKDGMNTFYKYELKNNKLLMYGIDKPYRDRKFNSQKELLKFLKKNIKKNDFFKLEDEDDELFFER